MAHADASHFFGGGSTPPTFGTPQDTGESRFKKLQEEQDKEKKRSCELRGGKWEKDPLTGLGRCIGATELTKESFEKKEFDLTEPKKDTQRQNVKLTPEERAGMGRGDRVRTDRFGNERIETVEDQREAAEAADWRRATRGQPTTSIEDLEQRDIMREQQAELSGQIGQFGQMPISPTGFDVGEAFTTASISSIPTAMRLGATAGLGIGAIAGTPLAGPAGTAIGAVAGAAIGAVVGFAAGLVGGMTSNFKSQRTDTTTAQQRVLDEGKQSLQDWATMASADPANSALYLSKYNLQLAQIDQAYRQMKLDTNEDIFKFETALPNLAEFVAFYSIGGERDALNSDMRFSLGVPKDINNSMLQLTHRHMEREGKFGTIISK